MQPVAPPGPSEASAGTQVLAHQAMVNVRSGVLACLRNNADRTHSASVEATFDNATGRVVSVRGIRLEPEGIRGGEIRNCIERAVTSGAHFTPVAGGQGLTTYRQPYSLPRSAEPSPLGGGITPMGPVGPRF
jgi:hypothetical protein